MEIKQKLVVTAKVSSKNQITIPREIRAKLDIHVHDELAFEVHKSGHVIVKKKTTNKLWDIVAEQQEKYGTLEVTDIEWGEDIGEEVVD